MSWNSLPLYEGWEYKDIIIDRIILQPGTTKDIVDRRMFGWAVDITVMTDNPYLELNVKEDYIEFTFTPFALNFAGLTREYRGFWLSRYDPVNSIYQVVGHGQPPDPFGGLWSVKVKAPDRDPVLGTVITTPTTILGGQVVWIEVSDPTAFRKRVGILSKGESE